MRDRCGYDSPVPKLGSIGLEIRALLEEFYANTPGRLEAAKEGLMLTVRKPESDTGQD